MPIAPEEVSPGLVVTLNTTVLRELGGSQTNAVTGPGGDRSVSGVHDFLVVGVEVDTGRCTAVPLFNKTAVGNQPLDEQPKSGGPADWIGTTVYFSRWQHWRIPREALVAASDADQCTAATRRRYAAGDGPTLDDVRVWESHNRAAYRDV